MATQGTLAADESVVSGFEMPGKDACRLVDEDSGGWRVDVFDRSEVWVSFRWGTKSEARLCAGVLSVLGREVIGTARPSDRDELVPTECVREGRAFVVSWLWLQGLEGVPSRKRRERTERVASLLGISESAVSTHLSDVRVRA